MPSKLAKICVAVTLTAASAVAFAATNGCCESIACCLKMIGCC